MGKTVLAKSVARSLRPLVLAAAVHARPPADGRHRRERLQPALGGVRVPAGAGLRERPPRRRDQPRLAEDAVGAARGDAGGAGHDRRRDLRARAAVLRRRDAEPDRVRGDVSAARGAARPLHGAPLARLSAVRRGGAHARRADDGAAARPARRPSPTATISSARSRLLVRSTWRRASASTSSRILRHTRESSLLALGASPRAGIALLRMAKARAAAHGATTSFPRTSRRSRRRSLAPRHRRAGGARRRGARRGRGRASARRGTQLRSESAWSGGLGARRSRAGRGRRIGLAVASASSASGFLLAGGLTWLWAWLVRRAR